MKVLNIYNFRRLDIRVLGDVVIFIFVEMVNSLRRLVELEVELTVEEHNLLSVAYKNVVGMRRAAWRILSSIEQKESSRGADLWKLSLISEYRKRTEEEIKSICYEILSLIDNTLLRVTQDIKTRAFFLKMYELDRSDLVLIQTFSFLSVYI